MLPFRPPRPVPKPARPAVDVERLLAQGRELHAQGRLKDAFSRYQAVLAAEPANDQALHLAGVCYLGLGMADIGMAFLRDAITKRPDAADYRVNLASALSRQGQLADAAAELAQACTLRPADAEARAELAGLQQALGRATEAEASYLLAINTGPARAEWHEALARLQYQRWAATEALASAESAYALSDTARQRLTLGFVQPDTATPRPPAAGLLRATSALDFAALEAAAAERDLLVVDDFLPDPLAFRAQALALCEQAATYQQGANFPGVQTPPQPCMAAMQRIADWLGQPLKWDSPDTGALRASLASDAARADVHVDSPTQPHIYGGVLYLSLPEHCQGGTSFYRHRATGWAGRPDAATLKASGYGSFLDFQKRHLPPNRKQSFADWERQRDATWEQLFEIPMRFNRLIVFRSDFFHAISGLFGDSLANGRLVQLFHFEGQR